MNLFWTSLKAHLSHVYKHIEHEKNKQAFNQEVQSIFKLKDKDLTEENLIEIIEDLNTFHKPKFWNVFDCSLKYRKYAWQIALEVLYAYNTRFVTGGAGNQFAWKGERIG